MWMIFVQIHYQFTNELIRQHPTRYRKRLQELLARKLQGENVTIQDPEPRKDNSNSSAQNMNQYAHGEEEPSPAQQPAGICGVCTFEYYQPYFNVTQKSVVARILRSLSPWRQDFFENADITPDLYGPFWILTTIIFLLSLMGNLTTYLNYLYTINSTELQFEFRLELIRYGTIIVYSFGLGFPLALGLLLRFFESKVTAFQVINSSTQVICLYGYSLSVFIPILVLCVLPFPALQWLLMVYGILNSTVFLILNMNHEIQMLQPKKKYVVYVLMALCQITLFLTFKLVFFNIVYKPNDDNIDVDDSR